jgi:hypothetical protein
MMAMMENKDKVNVIRDNNHIAASKLCTTNIKEVKTTNSKGWVKQEMHKVLLLHGNARLHTSLHSINRTATMV